MAVVSVEKQIKNFSSKLSGPLLRKAVGRSLNRTIVSTRKVASQEIRKEVKIKAGDLKKRLAIQRIKRGAKLNEMRAKLIMFGGGIPMVKLGARSKRVRTSRGRRLGVTAVLRGQRRIVEGGFLAKTKSGYTGVFARTGRGRYPIKQLYSGEMADLVQSPKFLKKLEKHAGDFYAKQFDREMQYQIDRELNRNLNIGK